MGDSTAGATRPTRCFGCAQDNPHGLRLDVEWTDGGCTALLDPLPEHEGPPGLLHGGLAAAALDETMGWAAHETEGDHWVTATLEVRYRRPVPLAEGPFRLEADTERRSGRRKRITGRLLLGDGTVAVEARSVFVHVETSS